MLYNEWFASFACDKKLVGECQQSTTSAVHTIRHYLDRELRHWEFGFTYTGKLVIREGWCPSHSPIIWGEWITRHDVDVPRSLSTCKAP